MAAKILAKALVDEGKIAKAIPSFGFERRGAPVLQSRTPCPKWGCAMRSALRWSSSKSRSPTPLCWGF
ncbi:MAG: hypothetical protein P8X80_13850 [Desulfobacterales bacterium]